MDGQIRFYRLLEIHLTNSLNRMLAGKTLTVDLLREARDEIRKQITDIFSESSLNVTVPTLNWIANQFFKHVKVAPDTLVNDLVLINEYDLKELPRADVELLKNLLSGTVPGQELQEEYDRRSRS